MANNTDLVSSITQAEWFICNLVTVKTDPYISMKHGRDLSGEVLVAEIKESACEIYFD